MQLSKKIKTLSQWFYAFCKSKSNFEHFEKDDDHYSWCISEITNCESSGLEQPLTSNMVNGPKHWHHLYHILWSVWRKLNWKKPLLVICKILEIFVNTLTDDDKYSLLIREYSAQPIQIQLSKKKKLFLNLFLHSWHRDQTLNTLKKRCPS